MIKFFRKIRQKMLTENKLSKYLIYAVGEIILVVIGILIALSINNWNENKKNDNELNSSLHSMVEELKKKTKSLNNSIKLYQNKTEGLNRVLTNDFSDEDLSNIISYFGQEIHFNFKSITIEYEFLKDNKLLQLIKDEELEKEITDFFENLIYNSKNHSEWHKSFVINNIDPYILENIPIENYRANPEVIRGLLKNIKFNNILESQRTFYDSYVQECSFTLERTKELKELIEFYINQK